ncbi:MAG: SDR family NAD(P)-dependent oxidoreductase [Phycisphaera sp.]|nr:SDR family NAD(P)-dependent oxidoreductase [Phycisphaera sp.]
MSQPTINRTVALVTGANRGIGRAITRTLLTDGARRVYAAARNPAALDDLVTEFGDRVVPLRLDVTDEQQVKAAAEKATDVNLLINNAGILYSNTGLGADDVANARKEMEVNYLSVLALTQAFVPLIEANGGGAVATVSSIVAHVSFPNIVTYSASKAAVMNLMVGLRANLAPKSISVHTIYPGPVDTDMASEFDFDKATTESVARRIVDGIARGDEDIFPDDMAASLYEQHRADPKAVERGNAAMVTG